ncbi:MAG TPA: LysR family transcriptional regulator [Actinocrinis sp.]|jgi:DNA-binding transcriptional LysR family regulator
MLDLRRLEILHRFAARGTIAATASDLGYSPSAISQQLATLEREAGVALIERTAQSASLTDAGRELVEHAAVILAAAEQAQARMRARAGTVSGRVNLSCIPGLAARLAPHLAALQSRHADLTIVFHETGSIDASAAVLDRSYDLSVIDDWTGRPPAADAGLAVHRLRREEVVLAVPASDPPDQTPEPVTAARLREVARNRTWLCAPAGHLSRRGGDHRLAAAGAVPEHRWQFEGLHILAELVAAGTGVALLPVGAADRSGIRLLRLSPRMHRDILTLARATARDDPAIDACLAAVRRALQDVGGLPDGPRPTS